MEKNVRISQVRVEVPSTLRLTWKGGGEAIVNLAGWIATGGQLLAPLGNEAVFAGARVADYGAAVAWDDDGDLAIDAVHLEQLAREQKPMDAEDLAAWQTRTGLSNRESADLIGVGLSTWNGYKAGASIPGPIQIVLRAIERDPILMQAHYRPRKAGRPRRRSAA